GRSGCASAGPAASGRAGRGAPGRATASSATGTSSRSSEDLAKPAGRGGREVGVRSDPVAGGPPACGFDHPLEVRRRPTLAVALTQLRTLDCHGAWASDADGIG